jgi:hypothetical protein
MAKDERVPRSLVSIRNFSGMASNVDASDLKAGLSTLQTNVAAIQMGRMEVRRGLREVTFEDEHFNRRDPRAPAADPVSNEPLNTDVYEVIAGEEAIFIRNLLGSVETLEYSTDGTTWTTVESFKTIPNQSYSATRIGKLSRNTDYLIRVAGSKVGRTATVDKSLPVPVHNRYVSQAGSGDGLTAGTPASLVDTFRMVRDGATVSSGAATWADTHFHFVGTFDKTTYADGAWPQFTATNCIFEGDDQSTCIFDGSDTPSSPTWTHEGSNIYVTTLFYAPKQVMQGSIRLQFYENTTDMLAATTQGSWTVAPAGGGSASYHLRVLTTTGAAPDSTIVLTRTNRPFDLRSGSDDCQFKSMTVRHFQAGLQVRGDRTTFTDFRGEWMHEHSITSQGSQKKLEDCDFVHDVSRGAWNAMKTNTSPYFIRGKYGFEAQGGASLLNGKQHIVRNCTFTGCGDSLNIKGETLPVGQEYQTANEIYDTTISNTFDDAIVINGWSCNDLYDGIETPDCHIAVAIDTSAAGLQQTGPVVFRYCAFDYGFENNTGEPREWSLASVKYRTNATGGTVAQFIWQQCTWLASDPDDSNNGDFEPANHPLVDQTFQNCILQSHKTIRTYETAPTLNSDYNVFYATAPTTKYRWNGADLADFADWQATTGQDANSVEDDPLLNADWTIDPGSPAEGIGTTNPIPGVTRTANAGAK